MEPHIKNFTKIESLIRDRPHDADRYALEWETFVSTHPEIANFQYRQEFESWAASHPGKINDTNIWVGKEIRDAYFYLRKRHEEDQMEQTGHTDSHDVPSALSALGFLGSVFSRERIEILEKDPLFKKILDEKYDAWVKDHPGKDEASKEWLDYRYGSLENPETPTLFSHAEEEFKTKHETLWKKYDKERKKIYDDPKQDPTLIWHQEEIDLHIEARHKLLQKTDSTITLEHVQKQVETAHWERFAALHPEKATAYALHHEGIKEALIRIEEKNKLRHIAAEKQAIHDQLTTYQHTTGKDIHYVEDKTHKAPDISVEEASRRLGAITPPLSTPPILQRPILPSVGLVDAQGRPLGAMSSITKPTPLRPFVPRPQPQFFPSISRMSSPTNSGGTPQPSPAPQPPPPGGRGIGNSLLNKANNLIPGLGGGNPLANLAKNAAIRSALAVIGPILFVSIMTFAIVFGAIGGEATTLEASPDTSPTGTGNQSSTTNGLDYTISFRDKSVQPIPLDQIKSTIFASWPNAKLDQWQTVIDKSIANGWNPAFVLTLWIEESGAQGASKYDDALGCDPSHPTTDLNKSLDCLFNSFPITTYSNNNFADFMCVYGGDGFHRAPCVFVKENPNFPKNIKLWYQKLVPSGTGSLTILPTPTGNPSSGTNSPIVPVGQGGQKIASAALQIAGQLLHSTKDAVPFLCDGVPPRGLQSGQLHGRHCWPESPKYDRANDPYYLQCTELILAAYKISGYEDKILKIFDAGGNAQHFARNARMFKDDFDVFTDARLLDKGDIISLGSDGSGHVALVIDKGEDWVRVAQASTSIANEVWTFSQNTGVLTPAFGDYSSRTRLENSFGFIRLKK